MAQIESWFSQDLTKPVKVHYIDGNVFSQDNDGNLVGVRVFADGEPATLSGTVSANVIRADGGTVAVSGTLSGNAVSVVLPAAAYAVPGIISIIVKLTDGETITTLCAAVANVYQSSTDTIIDPGTIIPSVQNLIADIEAAVATIPADYSTLWTTLAPTFSSSTAYGVGQYVTYDSGLYQFTEDHPAGSWSGNDVVAINFGDNITFISRLATGNGNIMFHPVANGYSWTRGTLASSTGSSASSTTRLRTGFLEPVNGISVNTGYKFSVYVYDSTETYLGIFNGSGYVKSAAWQTNPQILTSLPDNCKIRILMALSGDGTITTAEGSNINILKYTDETLTVSKSPADAKATGDLLHPVVEKMGRINYFNKDDTDIVEGQYISNISDGVESWTSNGSYGESGYIPVKPGDMVVLYNATTGQLSTGLRVARYDAQKTPVQIKDGANTDNYYAVPDGISFLRVPFFVDYKDAWCVFKLSANDALPFTPSGEIYTPYNGLSLPYLVDLINDRATEEEVESLRQQIAEAVSLGAQWDGKVWYAYGTSITNVANEGKYPTYLAAMSNMTLVNKGISGGGIGNLGGYSHGQVYNAICNTTDGKLTADLITLETGANDINAEGDIPLGTIYDTGTETLSGCLNDCIRYLQANTTAQIVIIPSPVSKAQSITPESHQYYTWADMIEQICMINRVHFIKPDNNMGLAKLQATGTQYVVDNIHQSDLGGFIMAQNIWYQLRNIPCFYTSIPT